MSNEAEERMEQLVMQCGARNAEKFDAVKQHTEIFSTISVCQNCNENPEKFDFPHF